jgi:pteridine reductase
MAERKVALVTGAGKRRVGWHVAQALAERGYRLAIHYRSSQAEAEETVEALRGRGVAAASFQAELSDETAVRGMMEGILAQFGRLDVLAHCAATWRKKRLDAITSGDLQEDWDANALAPFLCCQHAGLAMAKQTDGGNIVLIGDWATERPYLDHASYFLAKGAIPTLTRVMAAELASRNQRVRVNCILPGPVMLPPDLPAAEKASAIQGTLVKREGSPENIAQAVLHFVENDFVTGVCLPVDGGRTIYALEPGSS